MKNNRCNGNEENERLSPSDESINAWLDRIVLALDLLIVTPILGPAPTPAPITIPRRIQSPRRRTIALWIARRILYPIRRDLNASTRNLI